MNENIFTFQIGNKSNWVGSHIWPLLDKNFFDNEIFSEFYRETSSEKLNPFLISIDLKANIVLPQYVDANTNQNDVDNFQVIDKSVETSQKSWTKCLDKEILEQYFDKDYFISYPDYIQTPEFNDKSSEETFDCGVFYYFEEKSDDPLLEQLEDSFRKLSEESSFISGFNILFDGCDGFSGIFKWLANYLNQEYPKKCASSFPIFPELNFDHINEYSVWNMAQSLIVLESQDEFLSNSGYFPLSCNHGTLKNFCTQVLPLSKIIANQFIPVASCKHEMRKIINDLLMFSNNQKMFTQNLYNPKEDSFKSFNIFEKSPQSNPCLLIQRNSLPPNSKFNCPKEFQHKDPESFLPCYSSHCDLDREMSMMTTTLVNPTGQSDLVKGIYENLFHASSTLSTFNKRLRLPKDDMETFREEFLSRILCAYGEKD